MSRIKNKPELVYDARATLGEGPVWHAKENKLYWVNIEACEVHLFDPETATDRSFLLPTRVGFVVPRTRGGLVAGLENGFAGFEPATGEINYLVTPEAERPRMRINDGKCDVAGNVWGGSMDMPEKKPLGRLYRLDPDLNLLTVPEINPTVSNGIAWRLDNRIMYYIDSPTKKVTAYDFDLATGQMSNPRVIIRFTDADGWPDGMTIDAEDNLWIAHWAGARISVWDPATGERLEEIELPVSKVTSCVFGGPDLQDLYITSARIDLSENELREQPAAGGLFRVETRVRGTASVSFAG
jgi:sugar lactone lactonase YvrE